ncbi:MAG: ATP-dependent DNA helicase RecG [Alphaproteobacteria bacterium]|nr:ATP-dependent DNA helicase RecG [Alphaproteobacteria bacterium]
MAVRPSILYPYFRAATILKGVGPVTRKALTRLLTPPRPLIDNMPYEPVLRDMVMHVPTSAVDRRLVSSIATANVGDVASIEVEVVEHRPPPAKRARLPYRIIVRDMTGALTLTYFHVKGDYLFKQLPVGEKRLISGSIEMYDGMKTMPHPDMVVPLHRSHEILRIMPVYPLTLGISNRVMVKLMSQALDLITALPEWIGEDVLKRQSWQGFRESLKQLHNPQTIELETELLPRRRLAYDELLANQLALAFSRQARQRTQSYKIPVKNKQALLDALPFTLTTGQQNVLAEAEQDLTSGERMIRLLQGDVGSGKTIIAFSLMAQVAASGFQSVFMAPTDLLARQHEKNLAPLAEKLGYKLILLSGKMSKKQQTEARALIASGEAHMLVGTHAVFQELVGFKKLALVVVDEQHRFGVEQRLQLAEKGLTPHILQMTATPIPRSLAMTYYGDMEVSVLSEKPPGRLPIDTRTVPFSRLDEVITGLKRALQQGTKAYWVCPLIELDTEKEDEELAAVEDRLRLLQTHFGDKVGMVHGRMKLAEREEVMKRFAYGEMQLLVATTVIEVGVDVPEATIMVIEQAERFGLAQLHQLRGRVGRGKEASSCILLYHSPVSENAKARLQVLRETNDGFVIAEEDFRLRGAGDVLGTRQTGLPDFRFAAIGRDTDLMVMARDDVRHYLSKDPDLSAPRGQALRILLSLFDYEHTAALLKAA